MPVSLSYPLCTEDEVRAQIGNYRTDVKSGDGLVTAAILTAINLTSRFIEEYTGRLFQQVVYTSDSPLALVTRDPNLLMREDHSVIVLPKSLTPIVSITSIIEDTTALTYQDDYFFNTVTGELQRSTDALDLVVYGGSVGLNGGRRRWGKLVNIAGTFGYNCTVSAPDPNLNGAIHEAAIMIAANLSGENRREAIMFNQVTSLLTKDVPASAMALLCPYAKILV